MAYKYTSYTYDATLGKYVPISKPESDEVILYDDFADAPVKNAHGSSEYAYINLSGLDYGTYCVTGYYKLDEDTEIQNVGSTKMFVTAMKDEETGNKVIIYETVNNGEESRNIVTYDENNEIIGQKTVPMNSVKWESDGQEDGEQVKFIRTTEADFENLVKSDKAFYYITDSGKLYLGEEPLDSSEEIASVVDRIDDVESSLSEMADAVENAKSASTIILTHDNEGLVYSIYQGQADAEHKIGDINVPKDMVATSGSLYTATSEDTDLVEGEIYIRMTIANGDPFFIPVQGLIDVYTGATVQTGIQINVNNGEISATVKTLDGSKLNTASVGKTALSSSVQASLDKADSAVQSITEGNSIGQINVDGTQVDVHGIDEMLDALTWHTFT